MVFSVLLTSLRASWLNSATSNSKSVDSVYLSAHLPYKIDLCNTDVLNGEIIAPFDISTQKKPKVSNISEFISLKGKMMCIFPDKRSYAYEIVSAPVK